MLPTTSLIAAAQAGDLQAREDLFSLIQREHIKQFTSRYRSRNVLVDEDDIESEFLLGCLKALDGVRLDTGNPLLYLFWKGNMAVAHLLRTRIQRGVKAICRSCGETRSIKTKRGRPSCRACGSEDVDTFMVMDSAEGLAPDGRRVDNLDRVSSERVAHDTETVFGIATFGVQVEEMRARLNGRVLELFDLIVVEEINRETSQNYIREIAERWGVTTACVSVYLRKLRASIEDYLGE